MLVILSTIMVDTNISECSIGERLGRNIKQCRAALGLTQAQLAERLGMETETLSRFERGKHLPTLKNLLRMAEVLRTSVADLLGEEVQTSSEEATMVTAWLNGLSAADRAFALAVLKQCCDYLVKRQG